jgi:hypothetical protein
LSGAAERLEKEHEKAQGFEGGEIPHDLFK